VIALKTFAGIDPAWMQQRKESGLWQDAYIQKLSELQWFLLQLQPASVVELGSGLTTGIIDQYARDTGRRCTSIDEPQWLAETGRRLTHNCVARLAAEVHRDPWQTCRYLADYPPAELLYVDGPDLKGRVGTDALYFCDAHRPRWVLFDLRVSSREYLEHLSPYRLTCKSKYGHALCAWPERDQASASWPHIEHPTFAD